MGTIQRTNREDKEEEEEPCTFKRSVKMNKKRKSKIVLNEDEFREAYGFVRRNSMNQTKTRILTRQAKIESIEYPSDSTSYTSGDLLADGGGSGGAVATTRPFDTWSHRSSSGLGSESEELVSDHQCASINNELYDLPLKTLIKINRRTSK